MDEQLLKLIIGIATTLLTAIITFYFTLKINKEKKDKLLPNKKENELLKAFFKNFTLVSYDLFSKAGIKTTSGRTYNPD